MAFIQIKDVKISGIAACVPKKSESNRALGFFSAEEVDKFIASTGVENRHISGAEMCTSDLCFHSAEKLMNDLGWAKPDIDCIVFVTQTPDYVLPATSNILQSKLGLSEDCYCLDISLGCSGWIFGMSVISSLIASGGVKKGLLLAGDTISKICSPNDKSTYPLFGDAGTATAIEYSKGSEGFKFHTATDGSGYDSIIVPGGGYRNMATPDSHTEQVIGEGISRNQLQLALDGMNVFSFGISKAPESVNKLMEHFTITSADVDYFVFHQANLFMNEKIRKKLKLEAEKVPYSLKEFGNTSCASIPITLLTQLGKEISMQPKNILACGFGVGLSWGSLYFSTETMVCPDLIEV